MNSLLKLNAVFFKALREAAMSQSALKQQFLSLSPRKGRRSAVS